MSIFLNDERLLAAIKHLELFYDVDGWKSRMPSSRVKNRSDLNLSPIPNYVQKTDVIYINLKDSVEHCRIAILECLEYGRSIGELQGNSIADLVNQFDLEFTTDGVQVLDSYHTFIARLDPNVQKAWDASQKRDRKRIQKREELCNICRDKKIIDLFDALVDASKAIRLAQYYKSGSWSRSSDVVDFGHRLIQIEQKGQ